MARISNFRRFLLWVTIVTHVPFVVAAFAIGRRLGLSTALACLGALAVTALAVYLFVGRANKLAEDRPRPFFSTFFFDVPYFVHWCAGIYLFIPSVVYTVLEPLVDLVRGAPVGPSPNFYMWTYLSGLAVCGYGVTIRRWFFVTRHVDVAVRGLDARFDGYRVVHLSDLHVGALTPPWWARRWIARANAERADAIAVTGDLVTSGVAFHEAIAELIGGLVAKDGVFCSMGNHDYFGDGEPLMSLMTDRGARVLRNEGVVVEREGARLFVTAIDDTWTRRADLDRALEERPADVPSIMLAHDPDRFPEIAARGVDLVLSGHTHGGQIAMPFLGRWITASRLAHKFHVGTYKQGRSTLYVHPGLGTTGPPIRLGIAPAIVVLTLRPA